MSEKRSVYEQLSDLREAIYTRNEVASLLTMLIDSNTMASRDEITSLSELLQESLQSLDDRASKIMDYAEELGV